MARFIGGEIGNGRVSSTFRLRSIQSDNAVIVIERRQVRGQAWSTDTPSLQRPLANLIQGTPESHFQAQSRTLVGHWRRFLGRLLAWVSIEAAIGTTNHLTNFTLTELSFRCFTAM